MTGPAWLMLIGGTLWLIGELWGVWRNRRRRGFLDTTSEWVWLLEWRYPVLRILIAIFVVSLAAHFLWQTPLVI